MQIQVDPFLVSRNRTLDYRTVVAPKFMCDNGVAHELARAAGGDLTPPGYAVYRKYQVTLESLPENFILVFRIVKSNQKEIYSDTFNETLTDPFGREIFWIEGFIVQSKADFLNVTLAAWEIVHKNLLPSYRSFWESTDLFEAPIIQSETLNLYVEVNNPEKIFYKELSPLEEWDNF